MFSKSKLSIFLFLAVLSSLLSACVSGGVIEIGVEPSSPPGSATGEPAVTSEGPAPTPASPTETALPENRSLYTSAIFGLEFIYPSDWFGPDEYISGNTLRAAIGSDVVYPYGTDRTEQIYTAQNSYYITVQFSQNDQNLVWKETLDALRGLQDGESISSARSLTIRLRQVNIGSFEGVEYISTLSDTAQTEPVYTREVILVDAQSNVLTISGSPNNVVVSEGTGWKAAYQAVDEVNQALFHEIVASVAFKTPSAPIITGGAGLMRGSLCFPSEQIPPMNVFFKNTITGELVEVVTGINQGTFELSLPAGTYNAFSYLVDEPSFGGAYTNAADCGLTENCRDHGLVDVEIRPGETREGVQICDFYAPEFIPTNPKAVESADPSAAGLIYRWALGQYLVGADGQAHMLAGMQSMPAYSPDGKQAVFAKDYDIWLVTFADHSVRNLTNTTDRIEVNPQWWPANPEVVIFGSGSLAQGYDIMNGHLSMVRMDGSGYQVLSPDFIGITPPALSPDGKTIAHDNSANLWLYNLETNTNAQVDLAAYGLADVEQVGGQAWSPDGQKLALKVGGYYMNGGWGIGIGVIDFASGTAQRLHTYLPYFNTGWESTPKWSPDSTALAFTTVGEDAEDVESGLYLIQANGSGETYLGVSGEPVWSPDGRLVFVEWGHGSLDTSKVFILSPGGQKQQLTLTPGSIPVFWISE